MVDKKIILSGVLALFIYLSLIFIFFVKFQTETKKVSIASTQTEVFIDLTEPLSSMMPSQEISQPIEQEKTKEESASKSTDVNHLFNDIGELFTNQNENKQTAKAIISAPKEIPVVQTPKKNEVVNAKPFEYTKEQREEMSPVDSKLSAIKDVQKVVSLSSQNKNNDPCFSKIYQIFSAKWTPSALFANHSSSVRLSVYSNGGLDYMIIKKSASYTFDNNLKTLLDAEKKNIIKECIGNNTKYIDITFTNKGI